MTDKILVLSNCGSADEASRIARTLVEARLAACVNIVPGVLSLYRWQDAIEQAAEWTLLIKTTRAHFPALCAELRRAHSYEVPEIIALPIIDGDGAYLDWIDRETSQS
jgi:periplasmic divalent cation tolerance protein